METNTIKTFLDATKLALVREFFAWLLVVYLFYWVKQMDDQKTQILIETTKIQSESLKEQKQTELKMLELTNQTLNRLNNEKHISNVDN